MCPEGPGSNRFLPFVDFIPDWPLFAYLFPAAQDRGYEQISHHFLTTFLQTCSRILGHKGCVAEDKQFSSSQPGVLPNIACLPTPLFYRRGPTPYLSA